MSDPDRVMADIETLGIDPGAAIVSIGAVRFGADGLGDTSEASVNLDSCQDHGLEIEPGTLSWWLDQDADARQALRGGADLADVCVQFREWYGGADEVWANSPSFDCDHLEAAFERVGLDVPWAYFERRDVRTLLSLPGAVELDHDGVEHCALDDAKHQALEAAATLQTMRANAEGDE